MLRIKPGAAVWEARMLPLCYAAHLHDPIFNQFSLVTYWKTCLGDVFASDNCNYLFSGLQASMTSSRLDAPDLQLDCLSSDTEDESPEEDVTVVKISR